MADNVDHYIRTLDELDTFHGMGIIAVITPDKLSMKRLTRLTSQQKRFIYFYVFTTQDKVLHQTKLEALAEIKVTDPTRIIGDLWKCIMKYSSVGVA